MMSQDIKELAAALSKVQATIKGAVKDSSNPFYKSKYADLTSVWDACRDALVKNGFSVAQTNEPSENGIILVTTLLHSSGQFIEGKMFIKPSKDDPQGFGSAMTYARRYGLAAIVGVCPEDDDANAASIKNAPVKIAREVQNKVHEQSLECLAKSDDLGLKQIWEDFDSDQKVVLWGMFNSQERTAMKKLMGVA